ncbi:hypothetical protein GF327_04710 [Candidatus Woesearchaeota archaeon]|nr:hypothetical protein [Candidatus Woesearchaeota archaeon]
MIDKRIRKISLKKTFYVISAIVMIPLLIFFYYQIKASLFVTAFIIANIALSSYKKNFQFPIEIEILTLGIILSTFLYGIKAGLLIAILGTILSSAFYGYYSPFLIPMIIGNMLVALLTPLFFSTQLFLSGLILSMIKNGFVFIFYHFVFNYHIGKNLSFGITNIIWNSLLFVNIAPILFTIMK